MPLVTVKSKFQVTIPAGLRKDIDLREGDLMEATLVGDGILLRPKDVVDRITAANRIAARLAAARPSPRDRGLTEDEIMKDTVEEISASRRERRARET
ncbi:MAG: AbrB/MazE/SpoVT family DNA-binding domain-containing protein [bacterium]|nr:AbrB/MazE/SpoVT family DNA-binding domain-containing protein [bacterium]MDE0419027.1 AbrB/MazE/SpoVT family DNA-binding domain-containing protein [bacterium]